MVGRNLNYITRLISRKQFTEAESILNKIEANVNESNRQIHHFLFNENKGVIFQEKKQFNEAITHLKKAKEYAFANDDAYQQLAILGVLAKCLMDAGQSQEARPYIDTLLNKSIAYQMKTYRLDAYTLLAAWHEDKADMKSAYEFLTKKLELLDTIMSDQVTEKVAMTETRYKVAGKDREIKSLQTEKEIQTLQLRQKNFYNKSLLAGALSLLVVSILVYRNYKHLQKLQQAKIDELEAEKN